MAAFDIALTYTLNNEGNGTYTNNPIDNGGPTRWGVTLKTLSSYRGKSCTASDVQTLTRDEATAIYRKLYWALVKGDSIQEQAIAMAAFDASVLFGTARASRALQAAINVSTATPIKVDGIVGPATLAALNAQPCKTVLQALVTELEKCATDIVDGNAKQLIFFEGWSRRVVRYIALRWSCVKPTTPVGA